MAIKPVCDKCGRELSEFGALLFSPPVADSKVIKFHLCLDCYQLIIKEFPDKSSQVL